MKRQLIFVLLALASASAFAADELPKTLMTTRGKLLASEDFTKPLAPLVGKPTGFASGFTGWRYTAGKAVGRSGHWELRDGVFRGIESPTANHPATASFGIQFKDAIIQVDVRLEDVSADGRKYRTFFVKATDAKDYVCALFGGTSGINALAYDAERIDPANKQRAKLPAVSASTPVKLGEWHTAVLEIKGEELVATLDGKSVTLSSPLVGVAKHSVMLGVGTEASFRNFRMWEALPNPEWPKNKATLTAKGKSASVTPAKKSGVAEIFHAEKLTELDSIVEQAIRDAKIVGAALWVERNGVAYHKAFGNRALSPAPEPMTEDTIFDVASITKVVATATAAMQCIERGLIKLDDSVAKHVTAFTGGGREKITMRHLLLHTSGLKVNLDLKTQPFANRDETIAQACLMKPQFEPGSAYSYSSVGTMLLAAAVEHATGKPLDEYCTQQIFRPLHMNDTMFRPAGETLRRVAPSSAPQRGQVDDFVARAMGGLAGHASLFTTTADLARFARMMLNLGELDGARVLRAETVKLMTSVQSPQNLPCFDANNLPARRGLGWNIDTPYHSPPYEYSLQRGAVFPVGSYGHAGWTGQSLWIDPFSRTFVIFLCNRYGPGAAGSPATVYQLHHRIATLAAEAVKGFDFKNVPGALPDNHARATITKSK